MSTTTFHLHQAGRSRRSLRQWLTGAARRAWSLFELWHARTSERRALRDLPAWLIKDAGLSRERIRAEAAKPFWLA